MKQTALLVFDLETVPDTAILPADRDPDSFPKPIQHQIVSLGYLLARIHPEGEYERYQIRHFGAVGWDRRKEAEIIAGFWQIMEQHRPRVVSWNGRGFDIPVLKQRSLVYGLNTPVWHRTDPRFGYDYRYNPAWHCDLMDVLCDQGASPRLGMEEAARALGLPGKIESHGSEVGELAGAGDYERINRYCEGDVLNTYVLYLRWAYFSTRMSAVSHNASIANLRDYLSSVRESRSHLGEFLDHWQASERPCPLEVPETPPASGPQAMESHLRSEDVLP